MKKSYLILILLIALSIGAILSTLADSSTYASLDEAFNDKGSQYHVVGKVNFTKTMEYNPALNANRFTFYLKDMSGRESKVLYLGAKPQDFEKSEQIVISGFATDSCFLAENILMKCPSKYENTGNAQGANP